MKNKVVGRPFEKGHQPFNKGKKGLQIAWNKGLTKENNEGVKKYTEAKLGKKRPDMIGNKLRVGLVSPNYKDGFTSINRMERVKFAKTMQRLIFERDGYKCQICGKGGDLQVDHIQSWAEFKDLRFDPENCRTLCAKCHYKITYKKEMPTSIKTWGHNLKQLGGDKY